MGVLTQNFIAGLLKKFVKNIEDTQVKSSLWSGYIILNDIELNVDAVREQLFGALPFCLDLVCVKVDTVKVTIPWSKIRTDSVTVEVGDVEATLEWHAPGDEASSEFFAKRRMHWGEFAESMASNCNPSKENRIVKVVDGLAVSVNSAKVTLLRQEAEILTLDATGIYFGPEQRKLRVPEKPGMPHPTKYKQARRFNPRLQRTSVSQRLSVRHAELKAFDGLSAKVGTIVMALEKVIPSNGQMCCPFLLGMNIWLSVASAEVHATNGASLGRLLGLLDEFTDAEKMRADANAERVDAKTPIMALDDFLASPDSADKAAPGTPPPKDGVHKRFGEGTFMLLRGQMAEEAFIELEAEEVADPRTSTRSFADSEDDDVGHLGSEMPQAGGKFDALGTHMGILFVLAAEMISIEVPSARLVVPDVSLQLHIANPLEQHMSDCYVALFGSVTSPGKSHMAGSLSVGYGTNVQAGEDIAVSFDRPSASKASRESVASSAESGHGLHDVPILLSWETVPHSVDLLGGGLGVVLDLKHARVKMSQEEVMTLATFGKDLVAAKTAFACTRPSTGLVGNPVPFKVRISDFELAEASSNFDKWAQGRFPIFTSIRRMEVRTIGPSLVGAMRSTLGSVVLHRGIAGSHHRERRGSDDNAYADFWEKFLEPSPPPKWE